MKTFYDNEKNTFVRNLKDRKIDSSIAGLIVSYNMFSLEDKKIQNTIDKINLTLRTYTGGYIRYENDNYLGVGNIDEAIKCFNFVINSSTEHGFLGEQINNEEMKPCWVIGLTWSHAMFLITLKMFLEKGLI